MFSRTQKICILAFVIAPVLVFGNANRTTIAATETTTSATVDVAGAAASAVSTAESITATTSTLASSNSPATIADDVDAAQRSTWHGQDDKVEPGPATTRPSTTADAKATSYLESKSRAATVAVADQGSHSGNEAKTQIKNAKKPTNLEPRSPTKSRTKNEQEAATTAAPTKNSVVTSNTPEPQTTTDKVATVDVSKDEAAKRLTTSTLNNDIHVEGPRSNGLYLIKLAEIVTDEFRGPHEETPDSKSTRDIDEAAAPQPPEYQSERHYEVFENVEDDNGPTYNARGKLNIVDLYPMKIEDFNPIIRDANAKLLRERTIFTRTDDAEHRQNLLPNEVDDVQPAAAAAAVAREMSIFTMRQSNAKSSTLKTVNHSPQKVLEPKRGDSISDFTGKLLAEQDGVITEIEQKFRLNEYTAATELPTSTTTTTTAEVTPIKLRYPRATEASNAIRATANVQSSSSASSSASASPSTSSSSLSTSTTSPESINLKRGKLSFSVNHKILHASSGGVGGGGVGGVSGGGVGHDFIDRRVKKSFDFPMHRAASDVMAMPHIDFANTKFNTETSVRHAPGIAASSANLGDGGITAAGAAMSAGNMAAPGTHPEFSTTKFYNSKELYNEMLQHNKQKLKLAAAASLETSALTASASVAAVRASGDLAGSQASSRFGKIKTVPLQRQDFVALAAKESGATTTAPIKRVTLTATTTTTTTTSTTATTMATPTATATIVTDAKQTSGVGAATLQARKYQKEMKRAKLLLKAMMLPGSASTSSMPIAAAGNLQPIGTATQTAEVNVSYLSSSPSSASSSSTTTGAVASAVDNTLNDLATTTSSSSTTSSYGIATSSAAPHSSSFTPTSTSSSNGFAARRTSTAAATAVSSLQTSTMAAPASVGAQHRATNPTKSTSKPIARPRILSRLQEKINSLECELQNVPQDSHLWRGNETHELLLPIVSSEHCKTNKTVSSACLPMITSWEGEAEIQSGDILIVEINDASLSPNDKNHTNSAHNTQVYQVTRSGHEHCDVTEGILLDITPLVVDGRKLVTLYDKDLTEGVNLLIVVSELWGSQCVRLKVTTKTDNCGENADCSGKGVCYSDAGMEEYECQCCSGFAGPHCEEIDACTPSPCTNNGICVDLSQGHEGNAYQCLCPYGYTGKNCQYELDPCNPTECMNGGTCVGTSMHFRCDCTPGYTGPLCQHSLNECESSPCVHGICVDQEDGFRCFCQPGFAGELCNFEYNECESNPCQNGGECIDHIGSYECRCTKGYSGNRCHIKVDFCANKPCPEGHRCIDHGNDFSCECPGGRNGPDCNQMPRTMCNVNPCTHGGTCWSSGDSFYCACRPGYTGTMCEDEFVVETVVSSSEFMVDDTSARNFNDKTFGSSVVLKSPIELHNAYFGAGVLAAAIFIVAIVVTICHCKVNQTYRKFSTRSSTFFPILGFGRRPKSQNKLNKHWLSGKGLNGGGGSCSGGVAGGVGGNPLRSSAGAAVGGGTASSRSHLLATHGNTGSTSLHSGQLHERPFQRHLAMNLENDMYYTVDFSENSQHSPLIQ